MHLIHSSTRAETQRVAPRRWKTQQRNVNGEIWRRFICISCNWGRKPSHAHLPLSVPNISSPSLLHSSSLRMNPLRGPLSIDSPVQRMSLFPLQQTTQPIQANVNFYHKDTRKGTVSSFLPLLRDTGWGSWCTSRLFAFTLSI